MGLSTRQIQELMDHLFRTRHKQQQQQPEQRKIRFLGVFAFDMFPLCDLINLSNSRISSCCIVNIEASTGPGKHWVAFFMPGSSVHSRLEFFDSYSKAPSYYEFPLSPAIAQNTIHNPFCLQSDTSTVCGQYCVVFLCLRAMRHAEAFFYFHVRLKDNNSPSSSSTDEFLRSCRYLFHLSKTATDRDKNVQRLYNELRTQYPLLSPPPLALTSKRGQPEQGSRPLLSIKQHSN